jgi:hypothetical protein
LTTIHVVPNKNLRPKLWLTTPYKVTSLLFEHRVLVGDCNKFVIAESFGISNVREIRITLLAELANYERLI